VSRHCVGGWLRIRVLLPELDPKSEPEDANSVYGACLKVVTIPMGGFIGRLAGFALTAVP